MQRLPRLGWMFASLIAIGLGGCALNPPTITRAASDTYLVSYPLIYEATEVRLAAKAPLDSYKIVVPVGFVTDSTSIPRLLWWWESPFDRSMGPAIIYDYLYWAQPCTKEEADVILYLALRETGMGDLKRQAILDGVDSVFGKNAWSKNAKRKEAGETRFVTAEYVRVFQAAPIDPSITTTDDFFKKAGPNAIRPAIPLKTFERRVRPG